RHDEELAGPENDVAVAELDRQRPLQHEEEIVGVGMHVPDELALRLRDHQLVVVHRPDDAWLERLVEARERVGEVDLVIHDPRRAGSSSGTCRATASSSCRLTAASISCSPATSTASTAGSRARP